MSTGRRSYNQLQADWFAKHPDLKLLRQLSGAEDLTQSMSEDVDCDQDPEDVITDYAKRRGE